MGPDSCYFVLHIKWLVTAWNFIPPISSVSAVESLNQVNQQAGPDEVWGINEVPINATCCRPKKLEGGPKDPDLVRKGNACRYFSWGSPSPQIGIRLTLNKI